MLSPKYFNLLIASIIVFGLSIFLYVTVPISNTSAAVVPLKGKLLRRYDRTREKPTAVEVAALKKQSEEAKEERKLEIRLRDYLPIKAKLRQEKEKAFKDLSNDKWIQDLEVEVKNIGTKPIYYIVLIIDMPELKYGESNMIFVLRFGDKKFMNFAAGARPDDLSLKPGETCILKPADRVDWKEYSRGMSWPKPKQLILKLQEINFGDGTGHRSSYDGVWPPDRSQNVFIR